MTTDLAADRAVAPALEEVTAHETVASPADVSLCAEGQRDDVFSLSCERERAPGSSTSERMAQGWPSSEDAIVCRVVEACGRLPPRALVDPFFLDPGDYTVDASGRQLRIAFFPTDCTPSPLFFRTPAALSAPHPADYGGSVMPNVTDVEGAVRGEASIFELTFTTFTLDLSRWCGTP